MINCPKCQSPNDPTAGYCDQCGHPLAGGQQASPVQYPSGQGGFSASGDLVCSNCSAANMPGEMYCQTCGWQLSSGGGQSQAPYVAPQPPTWSPPPVVPAGGGISGGGLPAGGQQGYGGGGMATGYITAPNGQSITLSGKSTYLIGREDPVTGIYPDVNTAPSGGEAKAVSRRHAEIFYQQGQWFIRDMNSVNGTWVNNHKLAPNQATPISSADTLRLGGWEFKFQGR